MIEGGVFYNEDAPFKNGDGTSMYIMNKADKINNIWASAPRSGWIEFLSNGDYVNPYKKAS
jgi:hypothetical protein